MKTILVPTDFSDAARNAAQYAAKLARSTGAGLLLLHAYQLPISISDVPVIFPHEELEAGTKENLAKAKAALLGTDNTLSIDTESYVGDLTDALKEVGEREDVILIVAGRQHTEGMERFLFGGSAQSIVRYAKVPVIAVPDTSTSHQIQRAALAFDAAAETAPSASVTDALQSLNIAYRTVYVQTGDEAATAAEGITIVRNEDFTQGILSFIEAKGIDLLIVQPHQHSAMERFFFKTHTATVMEKTDIPVMCFPAG